MYVRRKVVHQKYFGQVAELLTTALEQLSVLAKSLSYSEFEAYNVRRRSGFVGSEVLAQAERCRAII